MKYTVSTNFTDGEGCGVTAKSWQAALEWAADNWNHALREFIGRKATRHVAGRFRWWRIDIADRVVCVTHR